jgi:hypothetical protein
LLANCVGVLIYLCAKSIITPLCFTQRRKAKAKAPRKPKTRTLPTDFGGSAQLKDRLQSAQLQKGRDDKRLALIRNRGGE